MAKYYSGRYVRSRRGTAFVFIGILAAVVAVALLLSAAGKSIAQNLLVPMFGDVKQSITPLPEGYKSGLITMPRLSLYTLELNSFADNKAADAAAEADTLRKRGGAGYVFRHERDSRLRLLASGYTTEAQARSVAQKQAEEYSSSVFLLSSGSVSFAISCDKEHFKVLQEACSYYPELVRQLADEAVSLERQEMTQTAVKVKYSSRASRLRVLASSLEDIPSTAKTPIINTLLTLYRNGIIMMEKISSQNFEYSVDFFAEIRYNYIEMACAYCQAVENLS